MVDESTERFKVLREKPGPGVDIGVESHDAIQPPASVRTRHRMRATARAYLLGRITPASARAYEEAFFENDDVFEDLLLEERDLAAEYIAGEQTGADGAALEVLLRANPIRRQRFNATASVSRYVTARQAGGASAPAVTRRLFRPPDSPSLSQAAAIALITFGALLLIPTSDDVGSHRRSKRELGARTAEQSHTPVAPPMAPVVRTLAPEEPNPIVVSLAPGLTRGSDVALSIVAPRTTAILRVRLELNEPYWAQYFATVRTADGERVWRGTVAQAPVLGRSEHAVGVDLQLDDLTPGDYVVELEGMSGSRSLGPVGAYMFRLIRPE